MSVLKYKDPETGEIKKVGSPSEKPTPEQIGAAPAYTYGTEDLIAGESELKTGKLHFVYE
jgi:hypothetical protein